MPHVDPDKMEPLEGRTVILAASAQPQPLLADWPYTSSPLLVSRNGEPSATPNAGNIYIGGAPGRVLPGSSGLTTGPVSTAGSPKGFFIEPGEKFKVPSPVSDLWVAGTEGDVLLFTLFPAGRCPHCGA